MATLYRPSSLILSIVLATLLVACGGNPSTATSTTAVPAMTAAPATAASAATASTGVTTAAPAMTAAAAATASTGVTTTSGDAAALSVFAAASLTNVFKEIGKNFEAANAGSTVTFNFAGSQQLAQQIGQSAPADVFAAASKATMNTVVKSGQVISGTQRTFARNRLVVIFPKDNPAGLKQLQDLAKPGLKLDLEAKAVPAGQYSLDVLSKASSDPAFGSDFQARVVKNVVSYEDNVRAVLTKVTLGEADAGIVYTTDINGDAASKVGKLDIPDKLNTIASYPIATIKDAKHADLAQKFVSYVLSAEGQMVLAKYGFIPTTGNAGTGALVPLMLEVK